MNMAGAIFGLHITPITPLLPRTNLSRASPERFRTPVVSIYAGSSYWAAIDAEIENHLRLAVQVKPPLSVYEPLHHFAFAAPTTTVPALCVASCDLLGGHDRDKAVAAASALRLFHAGFCAQDPLLDSHEPESVDNGPYYPNIRLQICDGMISFGMEMLARSDDPDSNSSGRILRVMIELSRAIGSQGVIEGKYLETVRARSSSYGQGLQSSHVERIREASKKIEGRLHACAAACGAILGGGSEDEIDTLRNYGVKVGTIQGFVNRTRRSNGEEENGEIMKEVEEMKDSAIKELREIEGKNVEALYGFVDICSGFPSKL